MQIRNAQALFAPPVAGFSELSANERRTLEGWLAASRAAGIEAVEDLRVRPWPEPGAHSIIGVFKAGHLLASWLIVGQEGAWAVASCADGEVSRRVVSLAEALTLVNAPERSISSPAQHPAPRSGRSGQILSRQAVDPSALD